MKIKRKTVSQCPTAEYCRGWNDAVEEMKRNEKKRFIGGYQPTIPRAFEETLKPPSGGSAVNKK